MNAVVTFGAIIPETRNEAFVQLLGDDLGQRMIDYLNGESVTFSNQEQAFIDAYDGAMVSFLNPRVAGVQSGERAAFHYADAVRDTVVSVRELEVLLSDEAKIHMDSSGLMSVFTASHLQSYGSLREAMGETLHSNLIMIFGGVLNGAIDAESDNPAAPRYQSEELESFYSPRAMNLLQVLTDKETLAYHLDEDRFEAVIANMNGVCGSATPSPAIAGVIGFGR